MAKSNTTARSSVEPRRLPQYMAATAANIGGFCLGCGIGWNAPVSNLLEEQHGFSSFSTNLVGAAFPFGAALGSFVVPLTVDRIGRKCTMLVLVPPCLVGWVILVGANSLVHMYVVGRIVTGACAGMFCIIAPMYTAEISQKEIRGTLGVSFQLLLGIGIFFAYCTGFTGSIIWISALCGLSPIFLASGIAFVPESPLYYLVKDREEDARKSMQFFRGDDFDIEPEIEAFRDIVAMDRTTDITFSAFLTRPMLKIQGLAYGLMAAQQLSGINAVIFYAVIIFNATGSGVNGLIKSVIFGLFQVLASLVSVILVDKMGRRFLMIVSEAMMCACLLFIGGFFILKDKYSETANIIYWVPLFFACLYNVAFCLGAGPVPWAYMGEIFPMKLKGIASSSAAFLNWSLAVTVTISYGSIVNAVGIAPILWFFGIVCALSVLFVFYFMVETKDKSLEQIQREFGIVAAAEDRVESRERIV